MKVFVDAFRNDVLWVSVLASIIAQFLKAPIHRLRTGNWDWSVMANTGGMPSSHTAIASSLATGIGFRAGFDSPLFALAAIFAGIVMQDATGVRQAAGKHAYLLNRILGELFAGQPIEQVKLRELLGHTRWQVIAGLAFGIGWMLLWLLVFSPLIAPNLPPIVY